MIKDKKGYDHELVMGQIIFFGSWDKFQIIFLKKKLSGENTHDQKTNA